MKKLLFSLIIIILFSCNHATVHSGPDRSDTISQRITDTISKVSILKGWGKFIYKDSIYTLRFTGNKDSIALFCLSVGTGATMKNRMNGQYEFRVTKDVDSTFICISRASNSNPAKNPAFKRYMTFLICVKKIK